MKTLKKPPRKIPDFASDEEAAVFVETYDTADLLEQMEDVTDLFELAQAIHRLRQKKRLSLAKLAKLAGASPRTLERLESHGVERVPLRTLKKIAQSLGAELVVGLRLPKAA